MHQGRPHGKHGAGVELTKEDEAAAELLVRRLTNLKDTSGLDSIKMVRTLPSGATAIAVDAGGVLRLIYQAAQSAEEQESEGFAVDSIPMLFCGLIGSGLGMPDVPVEVRFTRLTQRRLSGYPDVNRPPSSGGFTAPGGAELVRFNCRLPLHLKEFGGLDGLDAFMTQYHRIRPTWWSGAMAQVVQIVGGYGRQDVAELPDDQLERATMRVPERSMRLIREELLNVRLPGYLGTPPENGQFTYDFRFRKTNGVTFDSSGSPWLTQVSRDGVYVMPLPIIPATRTEAFRLYMEDVGDSEILWALDRFGGLPSGESFPSTEAGFEAWRRAGVIIKVCEAKDFYQYDAMASSAGWSFNLDGTEGFNTATGFSNSLKIPFCVGYKIKLNLAPAENNGMIKLQNLQDPDVRAKVDSYMSGLFGALTRNKDRERAIKYKLRRVEASQIISRASGDGASDVDYWDNLELKPIASHRGSCKETTRGWIYPQSLSSFKLPEPIFEGCVSHAMVYESDPPEKYPLCDTVIYGYYIGDDLKVIKYFSDQRDVDTEVETDFEDCMIVGSWFEKRNHSPARILGNLYTTDFDERDEVAADYTLVTVKGSDLGYPYRPSMSFHFYFWRHGTVWRDRYYGTVTNEKRYIGKWKRIYCYVPFMSRNAAVYGSAESSERMFEKEKAVRGSVRDPNSYDAWTYDFVWHWAAYDMDTSWMDSPTPFDSSPPNPFWIERHNYNVGHCSDWADDGDFIGDLPADYTWLMFADLNGNKTLLANVAPPPHYNEYSVKEQGKKPDEEFINSVSLIDTPKELSDKEVSDFHFTRSPDEFRNVFYQDAIRNQAGDAEYASLSDTGGQGQKNRTRYGYTVLADHSRAHHFIGVINE